MTAREPVRVSDEHTEAARRFLKEHTHHVGLTLMHPLATLLAEREAAAAERMREQCAEVADRVAHDYEGDWSCPEFNSAADIARDIRALEVGE